MVEDRDAERAIYTLIDYIDELERKVEELTDELENYKEMEEELEDLKVRFEVD